MGAASLEQVAKHSGYSADTLHNYDKTKPERLECMILGSIAIAHGVTGEDIKNIAKIKGGKL